MRHGLPPPPIIWPFEKDAPLADWREAGIGPDAVDDHRRVTRDNWRLYPYVRWAIQHTRELVPSRGIDPADHRRPLPERPLPLADVPFTAEGHATTWGRFVAGGCHDAILVLHRGSIVFEHFANGMAPTRPHMLFSITKSIVGLVAEILIARGTIGEGVTAAELVPELAESAFGGASLRSLLDMVDNVAFEERYGDDDAELHKYSRGFWTPSAGLGGVRALLPWLGQRSLAPGRFAYRTPVADVVGWMLNRATGRRLADLVVDHVWRPAGCGDEAYMLVDTAGHEIAGTGFNASPYDLARLAAWLTEDANSSLRVRLEGRGIAPSIVGQTKSEIADAYRSFWWQGSTPEPWIGARGVYGQQLWISPRNQIAIICLSSWPTPDTSRLARAYANAFDAVAAALAVS